MTKELLECDRCSRGTHSLYKLVIEDTVLAICRDCKRSLAWWWYQGIKHTWSITDPVTPQPSNK